MEVFGTSTVMASDKPSRRLLQRYVIPCVATKWRDLGAELFDGGGQNELNIIETNHGEDGKKYYHEMFHLLEEKLIAPELFKWKKGKMLGRGAFGEVFQCMDEDNDRLLAVKGVCIDPNFIIDTRQACESLEREIQLIQKMKHDRIVQYYGTERTDTSVRIFMEYMPGGSLYHHIDQFGVLKEQTAGKYTKQLLEGLEYLHSTEIIHRDIKGGNILLDLSEHVKIADFGTSKLSIDLSSGSHKERNNTLKLVVGTRCWMAPEMITGKSNYSVEVWSLACMARELFIYHPRYHHLEPFLPMYKNGIEPMRIDHPPECSEHAQDFLYQCFTRIEASEKIAHLQAENKKLKKLIVGFVKANQTLQGKVTQLEADNIRNMGIFIGNAKPMAEVVSLQKLESENEELKAGFKKIQKRNLKLKSRWDEMKKMNEKLENKWNEVIQLVKATDMKLNILREGFEKQIRKKHKRYQRKLKTIRNEQENWKEQYEQLKKKHELQSAFQKNRETCLETRCEYLKQQNEGIMEYIALFPKFLEAAKKKAVKVY